MQPRGKSKKRPTENPTPATPKRPSGHRRTVDRPKADRPNADRLNADGRSAEAPPMVPRTPLELRTLQFFRTVFGSARTHDLEVRKTAGISGSQLWALSEIAGSPLSDGLTVNGLSEQMALHQTTAGTL